MNFIKVLIALLSCVCIFVTSTEGSGSGKQTKTIVEQKPQLAKINGVIVSANVKTRTIIVKTEQSDDTLNVDPDTKIILGKMELSKELSLGDLQPDDEVTVTLEIIDKKIKTIKIIQKSALDLKWEKDAQ